MDEILEAVKNMALSAAAPYTKIDIGSMPAENGLTMYIGSGAPRQRFLDRAGLHEISVVLNGKHSTQQIVLGALSNIHEDLTRATVYPAGAGWEITDIETSSAPNYIEREESGSKQWLYGSILRVTYYQKDQL